MGESSEPKKTALAQASEDAMVVDTMGGRMHVRWDESAQATPHGQIVFFAEFLATAGVFDRWVPACPLHYSSPNASRPRDVLGTLMLGILAGSKRYAHIAGIRGDAVAAKALGLNGIVSEDSVRRALKAMELAASEPWMRDSLMASVRQALDRPWVLDMDATVKPLYGRQEGAEVGYNPHKPGRPSHVLHTFWVGNLRLVLDAVLTSGKQHTSGHGKAPLARLLDELGDKAQHWCEATAATATKTSSTCAGSATCPTCCGCARRAMSNDSSNGCSGARTGRTPIRPARAGRPSRTASSCKVGAKRVAWWCCADASNTTWP